MIESENGCGVMSFYKDNIDGGINVPLAQQKPACYWRLGPAVDNAFYVTPWNGSSTTNYPFIVQAPMECTSTFQASNIGIGTSNPIFPLHVHTTGSNNISIYSAGDISALSDARLKTDVQVIEDALDKMDSVHGYTFRWVRNGESSSSSSSTHVQRSAGVIAQEVELVLPEVVNIDPITGDRHVAYANMSALLIQAIKELKERVVRLETMI
jgi:hypothetical protein